MQRALATVFLVRLAFAASIGEKPRERHIGIDYTVNIDNLPTLTDTLDLWIPIPHDDSNQSVKEGEITSDYPYIADTAKPYQHLYQIKTGQYGNKMLYLHIDHPMRQSLMVNLQYSVKRREHLRIVDGVPGVEQKSDKDPNMERWLEPDRLVPIDDKIRGWAQEVVDKAGAKTDLEKARAIYNHVVSTVKYDKTGQGWGRGDIYYACEARRGNCTDFHAIFIGYARALGIPARFSIGLPLPKERGQATILGYHCWAEFYIKGIGWIPVDASEAAKDPSRREYFFGAHDENRVEFSRGRDITLTPRQAGEPLNYFVYPCAEVNGKPYKVSQTIRVGDMK
jgi:transglutaminase-like putative cysteine protease